MSNEGHTPVMIGIAKAKRLRLMPIEDRKRVIEMIESNVFYSPDGCWYWLGRESNKNRGVISLVSAAFIVYRVYYEFKIGPIPDGLFMCHTCDNPRCINLDHFFLGTAKDNSDDYGQSKLTPDQVREIRSLEGKMTRNRIGQKFGISHINVRWIHERLTWKHI